VVGASDWEICVSLRGGASQYASGKLNTLEGNIPAPDKVVPALDSDGSQFALTYTVAYANGLADVYLSNVYSSGVGLGLSESRCKFSLGQAVVDMRSRIASVHGSGGAGHDYFLAWDHKDDSQATQHEILGARYSAPVGGPYTQFCWGASGCPCGNNGTNGGCANSARPSGALLEATGATSLSEDSFVLHGPASGYGWSDYDVEVWGAMVAERAAGRTRLVGVSNVSLLHLRQLAASGAPMPAFVQNRCFARRGWDRDVRSFCTERRIVYQGFSLLTANPEVVGHPLIARIAARERATPAQVVFRFALAVGMLPLTGTSDREHMGQDLASAALTLSPDEVETIESMAG
jgi:hypothetical protein